MPLYEPQQHKGLTEGVFHLLEFILWPLSALSGGFSTPGRMRRQLVVLQPPSCHFQVFVPSFLLEVFDSGLWLLLSISSPEFQNKL